MTIEQLQKVFKKYPKDTKLVGLLTAHPEDIDNPSIEVIDLGGSHYTPIELENVFPLTCTYMNEGGVDEKGDILALDF